MDKSSFVIFELPEFTAAAGAEQSSLDALKGATETSYFRDEKALWVKLVVADAAVQLSPAVRVVEPGSTLQATSQSWQTDQAGNTLAILRV